MDLRTANSSGTLDASHDSEWMARQTSISFLYFSHARIRRWTNRFSCLACDASLRLPTWLGRQTSTPLALCAANDIWTAKKYRTIRHFFYLFFILKFEQNGLLRLRGVGSRQSQLRKYPSALLACEFRTQWLHGHLRNPLVYLVYIDDKKGIQGSLLRDASSLSLLEHHLGSGLRVCLRPGAAKSACFRAMDDFRRRSLLRNSSIGPVRLEAVTAGGTTSRGYNRSWVRGLSVATPSDRSHVYPENWSEGHVYDRMAHAGPYQSKLDSTATVAWKHPRSLLGDLVS